MYKLMIVEDEALVREAVLKMIDFQNQGFEVVAVCEDGQEAVEQYARLAPDLVITDICMPFVSGLELAALIAEAGRGTQVVIITGFDDFNFAKQAIKSQVASYILKPVTPGEFVEVLAEARKRLDEQHEQRRQILEAQRQIHLSSPLVRDQLFNRLIQGSVNLSSMAEELRLFGLDSSHTSFQIALVKADRLESDARDLRVNIQLLQFMIANIVTELAAAFPDFVAFQLADGRTALLGSANASQELNTQLHDLGHRVISTIRQVLKIGVTVGCGQIVTDVALLNESYASAQRSLDYRFLLPDKALVFPEDIRKQAQSIDLASLEEEIVRQVRLQDEPKLHAAIAQLGQAIRLSFQSRTDTQFEWARLTTRLAGMIRSEAGDEVTLPDQTLPQTDDQNFLSTMQDWLGHYCLACIGILSGSRNRENKRLSLVATAYIREHFADSQLSLLEVCNHAAVSLSYFSQLFKEETGKTFVEYLTEIRMEKARELLRNTDRMLYDIAELVGYESPAYFTVAFKKQVGIGPREYRKQYRQGS